MHLHCHLNDIILDLGPIHSFWCFSFERYNGILGSFTTNNRSIELQFMRKLTTQRFLNNMTLDKDLHPYFDNVVNLVKNDVRNNYSVFSIWKLLSFFNADVTPLNAIAWKNNSAIKLPLCYKERSFDNVELSVLLKVYTAMFPGNNIVIEQLSKTIKKYSSLLKFLTNSLVQSQRIEVSDLQGF